MSKPSQRLFSLLTKHHGKTKLNQSLSINAVTAAQSNPTLIEIKHRVGKPSLHIPIENWIHSRDLCVGRWLAEDGNEYKLPAGTYSWGIWWSDKRIGAYRLHDSYGNIVSYRLDVLKEMQCSVFDCKPAIEFSDLVVDMWLFPDDTGRVDPRDVVVEDEDEAKQLHRDGVLSAEEMDIIGSTVNYVLKRPQETVRAIDAAIDTAVASAMN